MFGGVPISVVRPPRRQEYESGRSNLDGGIPVSFERSITTGRRIAATPTLFINAEATPAVTMITKIRRTSLEPANRTISRPTRLAIPVWASPPLRMNTAQTVTTAGVGEAGKRLGWRHEARERKPDEGEESHQVHSDSPPDEEDEVDQQDGQDEDQIDCHGALSTGAKAGV